MNSDLAELRAIAELAYLYAYSPVYAYGLTWLQIVDAPESERQPVNSWRHFRRTSTPTFNNYIPWAGTDTVYSSSWLDLRAEPMILETPAFPASRFQNIQINDVYGHNIINRGTRTHGNGARRYLIAAPDWQGALPPGVDELIRGESWLLKLFARILVDAAGEDWDAVARLQDGFTLRPLSSWLGQPAPPAPAPVEWIAPDANPRGFECANPNFIRYLNFVLGMTHIHPSETGLMERFARIGIGPGRPFDAAQLPDAVRGAIQSGIDAAHARIHARVRHLADPVNGWTYPLDLRGPREILAGSEDAFLRRAAIARFAIWGPESAEVVYMSADIDVDGDLLDGRQRYTMTLDGPPPARGFWSYTVYDADTRLLAQHPTGRFKIGGHDRALRADADGRITLHVQHESPGPEREHNWLPVPDKPFQLVARLYWPEARLLDGRYQPPGLHKAQAGQGPRTRKRPAE